MPSTSHITSHVSRAQSTFAPPVMEARRWLDGVQFPPDRPLINVSQAAPVEAPPEALREVIAHAAMNQPDRCARCPCRTRAASHPP
ncbi:MAG: hypothetical protein AAFO72_11995, partial [Pseudomonadota bacterium]